MKTSSHKKFGLIMINNIMPFVSYMQKKAFLFGCVEPDYNFITYFRGSIKHTTLRGHNYNNSIEYMRSTVNKLIKEDKWGIIDYYRFGKLTHYILDSFTFPHNENYTGRIAEHVRYENFLAKEFDEKIKSLDWSIKYGNILSIISFIEAYHKKYLEEQPGINTDIKYSVIAVNVTASLLLPYEIYCVGNAYQRSLAQNGN